MDIDDEQTVEIGHRNVEIDKPEKKEDDTKKTPIVTNKGNKKKTKSNPKLMKLLYEDFPYTDSVETLKSLGLGDFEEEDIRVVLVAARGDINQAAGYLLSVIS